MPTPPPAGPSRPLPARCPGRYFCRYRHKTLNAWTNYPGFYIVCPSSSSTPVCMACPADLIFDEECQTCVHKNQHHGCMYSFLYIFHQERKGQDIPVSTRLCFDVGATLFGRQQRCYNVKTTSCTYWGYLFSFKYVTSSLFLDIYTAASSIAHC